MTFAAGFLLLIWVVVSILANGIALLHSLTKLRGLELFGYGAAAGVLLHGILGCAIALAPGVRWAFVAILVARCAAQSTLSGFGSTTCFAWRPQ
jgi:hypothetical protein